MGKTKALFLRHEALVKEFTRRGYQHHTDLDKKFATGNSRQNVFIHIITEQKQILKNKPCEC